MAIGSNTKKNIVLMLAVSIICFIILEAAVRTMGHYDEDGQFYFGGKAILPYVLPFASTQRQIAEFEQLERPYIVPDSRLGWRINNNSASADGKYSSNSIGIRSDREFGEHAGGVRIELFGDSFVHGDDVPLNETWAYHLEEELGYAGINAEIMNFGVGGYANDQAYLRWKLEGRKYAPDIVIIGFQSENCRRNLNIIRKFYARGTGIPFSKPRFVAEDGVLALVNSPTLDYGKVPVEIMNFRSSPLRRYEYFYDENAYNGSVLLESKFIAAAVTFLTYLDEKRGFFDEGSEESELCYKIVEKFATEASADSRVFIVHLPVEQDILLMQQGKGLLHQPLLERLAARFTIIDPAAAILAASNGDVKSVYKGHYTDRANRVVAAAVAASLQQV